MFQHIQEPITAEEKSRLEKTKRGLLFWRKSERYDEQERVVDVYQASVEKCFVPSDFNEELPLYVLDLGGTLLVLFGQWVFDPHTLVVSEAIFKTWKYDSAFFQSFSLRCLAARGQVFRLEVKGDAFAQAEQLPSTLKFKQLRESQFITRRSPSVVADLVNAGIAKTA